MKNGAKTPRPFLGLGNFGAWGFWAAAISIATLPACGSSSDPTVVAPSSKAAATGDNQLAMKGYAAFGSQCVSGFNTDPKAVKLELWSCPVNLPVMELAEPIQPLYLSADCARKVLTIRSYDKTIDVNWELMPDGSFYLTQDGISAKLKDDGSGNPGCSTPLSMDIWGQVSCAGPTSDQASIHFESVMWLNKGKNVSTGSQCSLPPAGKCYFHAVSTIKQCS
jgi:hypothetical protein